MAGELLAGDGKFRFCDAEVLDFADQDRPDVLATGGSERIRVGERYDARRTAVRRKVSDGFGVLRARWVSWSPRRRIGVVLSAVAVISGLTGGYTYWQNVRLLPQVSVELASVTADLPSYDPVTRTVTYDVLIDNTNKAVGLRSIAVQNSGFHLVAASAGGETAHQQGKAGGSGVFVFAHAVPLPAAENSHLTLSFTVTTCRGLSPTLDLPMVVRGSDRRTHRTQVSVDRTASTNNLIFAVDMAGDPFDDPVLFPGLCPPRPGSVLTLPVGAPSRIPIVVGDRLVLPNGVTKRYAGANRPTPTPSGLLLMVASGAGGQQLVGLDPHGQLSWTGPVTDGFAVESGGGRVALVSAGPHAKAMLLDTRTGLVLASLPVSDGAYVAGWYQDGAVEVNVQVDGPATEVYDEQGNLVATNGVGEPAYEARRWDPATGSLGRGDAGGVFPPLAENPNVSISDALPQSCQQGGPTSDSCSPSYRYRSPDGRLTVRFVQLLDGTGSIELGATGGRVVRRVVLREQTAAVAAWEDAGHLLFQVNLNSTRVTEQVAVLVRCSVRSCERVPLAGLRAPEVSLSAGPDTGVSPTGR